MTTYQTEIVYDLPTRNYRMLIDEQIVGYAANYHAAAVTLDELVAALSADPDGEGPSPDLAGGEGDECPPDFGKATAATVFVCEGFPMGACRNRATQVVVSHTSNDWETRRAIKWRFCDSCAAEWRGDNDPPPPDSGTCQACDQPATTTIHPVDPQTGQPVATPVCASCAQVWGAVV